MLLWPLILAEGIWKVHIFRNLSVCFQTSVYTLGEFHKNRNLYCTVFEELEGSVVDLTVDNISLLIQKTTFHSNQICVTNKFIRHRNIAFLQVWQLSIANENMRYIIIALEHWLSRAVKPEGMLYSYAEWTCL
jgi:hypothetical protein